MSAKEMFEELQIYEQIIHPDYKEELIMYSHVGCDLVIQFYLKTKKVAIDKLTDMGKRYEVDYKVFLAIQQQIKELGWEV
jgi:hypothetical protein